MIAMEFYMVIGAQAAIIGALTWINFIIHKRITKVENAVRLLDDSNRRAWGVISGELDHRCLVMKEKVGPRLLLD